MILSNTRNFDHVQESFLKIDQKKRFNMGEEFFFMVTSF